MDLNLPDGWLVASYLFQTVWNLQAQRNPDDSIKDYDLFYFDSSSTSETAEQKVQAHADHVLRDLGIKVEVTNQARVHLWYQSYRGRSIATLGQTQILTKCGAGVARQTVDLEGKVSEILPGVSSSGMP
jgi:hypothetical protein